MNKGSLRNQSAFTLVEVTVVIFIFGLMLVAAIAAVRYTQEQLRASTTRKRMEIVMDALTVFGSRNYRIPCPADPSVAPGANLFGMEIGAADLSALGVCAGNNVEGIVPYVALGLEHDDIEDGWGRHFTYRVSPAYADDPEASTNVHRLCRSPEWIEAGRNKNELKARFCCTGQDLALDVQICHVDADTDNVCDNNERIFPFDRSAGNYADVDTEDTTGVIGDNTTAIAYILISHGPNGSGAFLVNGTGDRLDDTDGNGVPDSGGLKERDNGNAAQRVKWATQRTEGTANGYFDDIVRWQTQDNIMARLRRSSCAIP